MPLAFELRAAGAPDFAFCWPIYRDAMQLLTQELGEWREPAQQRVVELALGDAGASILQAEGADAGDAEDADDDLGDDDYAAV